MEQSNNSNNSNNSDNTVWYRFPVLMVDREMNDALDGKVPEDQMEEGWYDVQADSIKGVRPYYGDDFKITGTLIFMTTGDNIAVEMKPSSVRKLLNYTPIKLENEFKTTSD